ncbi:MAG: HNH endonuclease [Acidobacteriota bacterium]
MRDHSSADDLDARVRTAAFAFLEEQVRLRGEVLRRNVLAEGFVLDGQRVPLVAPQGIFKPAILPEIPLTITTAPEVAGRPRPYEDDVGGGVLRYRYRGTDPRHRDNVGLRLAMTRQTPLIYLFGVVPGEYMPVWPVFVVGDDPRGLTFRVAVDDRDMVSVDDGTAAEGSDARRSYVTAIVLHRVHQAEFRHRVLRAYQLRCAICSLRHEELLEAAHILPDGHPRGEPIVPNGLALCKLHHAAFDRMVLGVRPDLVIELRRDILAEGDGPMLKHGLQHFHEKAIYPPRRVVDRPNPDFLAERYELFRKAG